MTNKEVLMEEIGHTDEKFVPELNAPDKKRIKPKWGWIGGLASAAAVLVLVFFGISRNGGVPNPSVPSGAEDSTEATELEQLDVVIHYVEGNALQQETVFLPASPQVIFSEWMQKNGIGDDVRLFSVKLNDHGTDTINDSVAGHQAGGRLSMTVTVTDTLRNYYQQIPEELLLESLQRTMTGYSHAKIDDYRLVLSGE
ncbi:MAG: hypothetical protein IJM90_00795 [Firmicutes bacterium]|nr:hypothetical protein [Bacillota bacterium]